MTSAGTSVECGIAKEKEHSPRLAVVLPTWPNRLLLGSQKMRSKQRITLFRFPKPSRLMASCFHVGSGGSNLTVFIWFEGGGLMATFRTPRVRVHSTRSAGKRETRKRMVSSASALSARSVNKATVKK